MLKKVFIFMGVGTIVALAIGAYFALKNRNAAKPPPQNLKAEEISVTFVEGWNNREIAQYLEKQNIVSAKDFLATVKSFSAEEYETFLPKRAVGDLQGFLYPDTYRLFASLKDRQKISAQDASEEIIKKLLDNFETKIPKSAEQLAKKQGLSLYEAIILASIVEKETGRSALTSEQKKGLDVERAIVAGIFYNRLNIVMPLQSDATINYATGKNDPAPSTKDLEINSPYNTYKYAGLPPTPICNPSLSSIIAVLEPNKTNYIYFLHEQSTGKAYYAETYEEHLANKARYLK